MPVCFHHQGGISIFHVPTAVVAAPIPVEFTSSNLDADTYNEVPFLSWSVYSLPYVPIHPRSTGFAMGEKGSASCPPGSSVITSAETCTGALEALGYKKKPAGFKGSWLQFPTGVSHTPDHPPTLPRLCLPALRMALRILVTGGWFATRLGKPWRRCQGSKAGRRGHTI